MRYAAYFDDDNPEGGFVVTFPDFPEAVTQGETFAEAHAMAKDALAMALAYRLRHWRRIDHPCSPKVDHQPAPSALPVRRALACGARPGRAAKKVGP